MVNTMQVRVTMDWYIGKITHTMRRVDFIQFVPKNQTVSGIEHGDFYFYEVKLQRRL